MRNYIKIILSVLLLGNALGVSLHAQMPETLEKKQRRQKVRDDGTYGNVTIRYAIGFYNFETRYASTDGTINRNYTLPNVTPTHNFELAVRLGSDKEGYYQSNGSGFNYYTSNTGLFTDMEIGFKTMFDGKPNRYNYSQTGGSGATNGTQTVDLGFENEVTEGVFVTEFDATQPSAAADGITAANRQLYGAAAASVTSVYFNNYYRLSPLNWLMNFGSGFKWFDASLGPSLRINRYVDYSDPIRFLENRNDNSWGSFMIGYRQYIQPIDLFRIRTHYFYPLVGQIARALKDSAINHDEHILDIGLDIYLFKQDWFGMFITAGYEYRYWNTSPFASDRFNRSTGSSFSNTRDGLEMKSRESNEIYLGIGLDFIIE